MSEDLKPRKLRKTRGKPTWVDVHVGKRVRQRRTLMGISQERLGDALDLTFQQVQKYERGANRLGAGRLFDMAKALDVPITYFFEDLPQESTVAPAMREDAAEYETADPLSQRETLSLVRAYYGIQDTVVRRRVFELVKSLSAKPDAARSD